VVVWQMATEGSPRGRPNSLVVPGRNHPSSSLEFPLSTGSYPRGASICPERGSHRSPHHVRSYLLSWSRVKRHRRLCSLTACDTLLPCQITVFNRLRYTPVLLPGTPTHFPQHPKVILAPATSSHCAPVWRAFGSRGNRLRSGFRCGMLRPRSPHTAS
jgi:hypothetical protein